MEWERHRQGRHASASAWRRADQTPGKLNIRRAPWVRKRRLDHCSLFLASRVTLATVGAALFPEDCYRISLQFHDKQPRQLKRQRPAR